MAEEPENLVLTHLREIRGELRDVSVKQDEMARQLDEQGKTLERIAEVAYLGVGIATATAVKLDQVIERMDSFDQRLRTVESRVAG